MSFSGRKNPSGIRPLLNVSLPLEATNLCNKHQASSRRFMSRLARFFEIAPGIRRAVHQPSCSFRHNSAAIPSKNPDGSIAARLRKRSGASERIGGHPAAPPGGTTCLHAPPPGQSHQFHRLCLYGHVQEASGLPAMPVNWRSFGKTPGRPRANGLARPSTATTSRLKTLWGCGLLVLSDRMAMKAAFRAT